MKKIALLLLLMITFSNCKSSKRIVTTKSKTAKIDSRTKNNTTTTYNPQADKIVNQALKYEGVK